VKEVGRVREKNEGRGKRNSSYGLEVPS